MLKIYITLCQHHRITMAATSIPLEYPGFFNSQIIFYYPILRYPK